MDTKERLRLDLRSKTTPKVRHTVPLDEQRRIVTEFERNFDAWFDAIWDAVRDAPR